jgi:RNA polymerase sigma-70 factor (ECF subfamily)
MPTQIQIFSNLCTSFVKTSVNSAKPGPQCVRVHFVATMAALMGEAADVGEVAVVDSLETLFRAHYARLVRALAVVSGSQETAADAVQEAFVKAHLHWRRIERYDDPVGWIRRVAINRLRDDHRRSGRKARALERLQVDARQEAVVWSNGTDVASLLADLPRQQRLAMAFFYVDNLSIAEVADTMKLSEGAVKFHLHQGRDRLRGVFSAHQEAQQ